MPSALNALPLSISAPCERIHGRGVVHSFEICGVERLTLVTDELVVGDSVENVLELLGLGLLHPDRHATAHFDAHEVD